MKNLRIFLSENFHFLVVKFSVYLNRCVFVMETSTKLIASLPQGLHVLLTEIIYHFQNRGYS